MLKISVIIPCRNEEKYIRSCVTSFLAMEYPQNLLEIIVVDGMSTDKTREIIRDLQTINDNIKLVSNPNLYTSHGMNLGIRNATNDYIMIASAHSLFFKNYISELIKHMKELQCDAVGGIIKTDVRIKTTKTLSICTVLSNRFGVGNSIFRIGTNFPVQVDTVPFGIYRKDIFMKVGLYNEHLIRNQDMEFSKRLVAAGRKIFLIPSAVGTYFARETFLKLAENNFNNGIWIPRTVYITKRFSSLSFRHFVPLLFVLSLILPTLLYPLIEQVIVLSALVLIIYLIFILVITFAINNKSTNYLYIFWSFIVLHFSYGFGSLIGIFDIKKIFINRINDKN